MRRWSTSFLLVAAGLSIILLVSARRAGSQRNNGPTAPDKPLTTYKSTIIYPKVVTRYDDLASLSRASTAIVLGTVTASHSSVSSLAPALIFTDFQATVATSFKGGTRQTDKISIRVPGGKVQIDGQHDREMTLPSYWKSPAVGGTYVFFLTTKAEPGAAFELVGGPQGLFAVTSGRRIEPQGQPGDLLKQRYRQETLDVFLRQIQRTVRQEQ